MWLTLIKELTQRRKGVKDAKKEKPFLLGVLCLFAPLREAAF
jgi:hypothetical protein